METGMKTISYWLGFLKGWLTKHNPLSRIDFLKGYSDGFKN